MKKTLIKIFLLIPVFFIWPVAGRAAMVGEQVPFYVDGSYDAFGRAAITATLQEISERAYIYTEDEWWYRLGYVSGAKMAIHNLALEFDNKIYPKLASVYGSPWNPGIDNDPKITILITVLKEGAGAYFNTADEYQRFQSPQSNEREMIYLSASYYDSSLAKTFLAHELQHLITFYQKEKLRGVAEEIWLNEARSEYVSTLLGYDDVLAGSNLEKRILDFFKNPSDSLTEWLGEMPDYGSVNLFMQYLVAHFGEQILTKMVQSPLVGIASVGEALKSLGFKDSFSDIFVNWTVTNYLNDCRIEGQKYCYLSAVLSEKIKIMPTLNQVFPSLVPYSVNWTDFVKDWSGHWYKFGGGSDNLKIDFQGAQGTIFKVAYIIEKTNGTSEVKIIELDLAQKGIGFVQDFGSDVSSVVLVPVSQKKTSGFSALEPFRQFSYKASLTDEIFIPTTSAIPAAASPNYPDGSLIRARGDFKVYIIKDGFKRWLQSAEFFKFYPHLKWDSVIVVTAQEKDWYQDAWLVRAQNDFKVYEINGDGTKHWLNMTTDQFAASGRKWGMVYVINETERDWYKTGAEVLFR